jgi:hypothetical protein
MNNYLSLNLVSGKLGRLVGGGRPTFIIGEQNNVQLYILDYVKPSTYPTDSLSDAYAAEINPVNYNSQSVVLRAGTRGGASILSTSSFSNLPNSISFTTSGSATGIGTGSLPKTNTVEGNFEYSSIPLSGSTFRAILSLSNGTINTQYPTTAFSYDTSISDLESIFKVTLDGLVFEYLEAFGNPSQVSAGPIKFFQISDLSFSFYYTSIYSFIAFPIGTIFTVSIQNIDASSNYGKYGQLDFSSPSWDAIIGSKNEKEIWMEAMIGSDTVSQGVARICRKMT